MSEKTIVGLDLGTDSIGRAVTDENFDLKVLNGKTAWGSRLFDEAQSSKGRRQIRSNKRRIKRRNSRIYLLNKMFENEITKIDNSFFIRLNQSNLVNEDRDFIYPLFNDKKLEEKFYSDNYFPTIYHLRKSLMNNEDKAFEDVRFLYLAINHIIKYRGNFLKEGPISYVKLEDNLHNKIDRIFGNILFNKEGEEVESLNLLDENFSTNLLSILTNEEIGKLDKKKEIKKLFNSVLLNEYKSSLGGYIDFFIGLICGSKCSLKKVDKELEDKLEDDISFSLNDSNLDNVIQNIEQVLGGNFEIVEAAKEIFDFIYVYKILNGYDTLSESYINIYDEHKNDLKMLKSLVIDIDKNKNNSHELYNYIFKDINSKVEKKGSIKTNYYEFIYGKRKTDLSGLNSFIKIALEENKDYVPKSKLNDFDIILRKCNDETLLGKVSNYSNSIIPHQLHEQELMLILNNAKKHFAFIDDQFIKRIHDIFLFRVPYYYGPFNSTNSAYSNIVKKEGFEDTLITFDNYKKVIDDIKTKEEFINVRINYCEHLFGEFVLPKNSIIYVSYILLDRLNTIKVNGVSLSIKEKQDLFDYILRNKEVSFKKLKSYFSDYYGINTNEINILGINESNPLIGYPINVFLDIFNGKENLIKNLDIAEEIIRVLTIYKDNLKDGYDYLFGKYNNLTNDQKKFIKKLKFNGYGSFSRKLLNGIRNEDNTILEEMWYTQKNFQQVLQTFLPIIDTFNKEFFGDGKNSKKALINDLIENTPALYRRPIIQALKILKDIKHFNKKDIDTIVIEVTRKDDPKLKNKESISRLKEVSNLIKDLTSLYKDEKNRYLSNVEMLKNDFDQIKETLKLKNKHIYLYFKQGGLDFYTGLPIDFNDLLNSNKYDVDHIYPQSKIKDYSLDNLVLVNRVDNQKTKGDTYPIPQNIKERCSTLWKYFHAKKLISDEKYARLTRNTPLTDEELFDFVNRQLNVVNYSNKRLKELIELIYPNTKVIFSKAQYPSMLRKEFEIYKIRELNDCHHAVDAYLNIISGVILNKIFGNFNQSKNYFDEDKSYNFSKRLLGYIKYYNYNDKIVNNCYKTDFLLTRRVEYNDGAFYDQNISPASETSDLTPIHSKGKLNNTKKYGGFSNLTTGFMLSGKQGYKKSIVLVSNYLLSKLRNYKDNNDLDNLLNKELLKFSGLDQINDKFIIRNGQKVKIEGGYYYLYSNNKKALKLKNGNQVFLDKKYSKILSALLYKEIHDDEIILEVNENGELIYLNPVDVDKLFAKLVAIANNTLNDNYTGKSSFDNQKIKDFTNLDLLSKREEVLNLLKYLNNLSKVTWRVSLNKVLIIIDKFVEESPSGLYYKEFKI